ncbi:MAG TPA: DNA mismatch repair protein MutS, partial [Spirochaetia bacterium]|nr:DNA mismatch repair protein MutS [Spirochaetia bacterium]
MQETAQTPLLAQYERIKSEYKNAILFFRLGDFYEMFYDDAIVVSQLLNLTLTKRQSAPMCGIPWHASRAYIARLLKLGKKIAICEQLTEPGKGKGIIERGVVEVLSPGTVLEDEYLDASTDTYIAALGIFTLHQEQVFALSWIAPASGEFYAGT